MELSARRKSQRRPLETCCGVIFAMARIVYSRNQNHEKKTNDKKKQNLSSWLLRKLFEFAIFFVSLTTPFHRHFLATLSVADDHILALQDTIQTYFPSSSFVFVKIFDFLNIIDTLPQKFDGFLKEVPSSTNIMVWLDWVLIQTISLLGLLVNVLGRWRDKGTKEKEIKVDRSFSRTRSISHDEDDREKAKLATEWKKATYKEALQKGKGKNDPMLDLFETGWIQNPIKNSKSADVLSFSRSDSYSTRMRSDSYSTRI